MPRRKKSAAEKRLAGTYRPSRDDPRPLDGDLLSEDPPEWLDRELHAAWTDIVRASGRLVDRDAVLTEVCARLLTLIRSGQARSADYAAFNRTAAMLQLDPAHRQALPPAERPENPFDEF